MVLDQTRINDVVRGSMDVDTLGPKNEHTGLKAEIWFPNPMDGMHECERLT